jgi:hypothetical protein
METQLLELRLTMKQRINDWTETQKRKPNKPRSENMKQIKRAHVIQSRNEKKNFHLHGKNKKPNEKEEINKPNAKKKVKIAENMLPIIAETTKLQTSLTLSTKFPKEHNEDMEKRDGYG